MADLHLLKPEFDETGPLGRHWYVAGLGRFWFSTEDDAKEAIDFVRASICVARSTFRRRIDLEISKEF